MPERTSPWIPRNAAAPASGQRAGGWYWAPGPIGTGSNGDCAAAGAARASQTAIVCSSPAGTSVAYTRPSPSQPHELVMPPVGRDGWDHGRGVAAAVQPRAIGDEARRRAVDVLATDSNSGAPARR